MNNWGGLIAFVLALGISSALAVSIINLSLTPTNLDEPLASVITALAGAAVGGLTTFLGVTRNWPEQPPRRDAERDVRDEPPV